MLEIIFLITFLIGIFGMFYMALKKAPLLKETVPSIQGVSLAKEALNKVKEILLKNKFFSLLSAEKILHISLSKLRIFGMKIENKAGAWLGHIRQKKNNNGLEENYWERIKEEKEKKNHK
jgi:hypothetical protein